MRFAVAHKLSTYLVVGFAYLAMTAGGGVQPFIALGGVIGLFVSWFWEPPRIRFERWSWLWTGASVFVLAYAVLAAVATGDYLGVGAQFLIWLVVAKAFNRRAARDWQQLYLLAFLMLVAGSVLDPELVYGACFLGFVISATWALTLFHLRREMEDNLLVKHAADRASERVEVRRILDSKRIVGTRFFVGTGFLSFAVFLASAAIFLALPRVGFGFFLRSHNGLTLSGFSDGVKLGGHGVIKNDSTVVMRVEIDSTFGGRDAPEVHWRGVAFDEYKRGQWRRSDNAPATIEDVDSPRSGVERHTLAWRNEPRDASVKQSVWLEPLDSDVLFGASNPHVFELAQVMRKRGNAKMRNDELRADHGGTIHYVVWSRLAPPTPRELRAAKGELPPGYKKAYLQYPPEITQATRAKALEITRGLTNDYDKAMAIQRYLKTGLGYTLELEDPGTREPIDFFLFARKQGHCEYFASAFAILARLNDIPTRQVNGFLGGEWNEYQGYVAVRAGDAHSWDEVYFSGVGWVTFNPTPASPGGELGRGGSGWRARLSRLVDTLRFQWTKWVIEYDLIAQLELFKDIARAIERAVGTVVDALASAKDAALRAWPLTAGGIGLVVAFVWWRRRRRPRGDAGTFAIATRARGGIARAYDTSVRVLAKHGVAHDAAATPRELAVRLADRPYGKDLGELVDIYYGAQWGGRADAMHERRAVELAAAIRDGARRPAPPPA